jgi:hypothetical protein
MCRDREVNDTPTLVCQDEEHVQDLKPDSRDGEEAYGQGSIRQHTAFVQVIPDCACTLAGGRGFAAGDTDKSHFLTLQIGRSLAVTGS